jgi:drug/metabolite transporter (DMT)-like permease
VPFAVALSIAILLNAVDRLVTRRALRDHDLPDEFLLVYQMTSTVLTAPFAMVALARADASWRQGLPGEALALVVATVCLWSLYSVSAFRSARLLELSVGSTIGRFRVLITALLGVVVFGESLSGIAVAGVVLLLLAFIPISKLPSTQLNPRGVAYALVSTLAISLAFIADKALTGWFAPEIVIFIGFAGTTVVAFVLNRRTPLAHARPVVVPAIVAGAAGAAGYFMLVLALATGPASVILPVYQASAILYVLAGIVLLGETDRWRPKVLAGVIATVGTVMVISS